MFKKNKLIGGGFLVFLFGVMVAIDFFSYFIEIPLLRDFSIRLGIMSNIFGIIIAFLGLLMIVYGFDKKSQGFRSDSHLYR